MPDTVMYALKQVYRDPVTRRAYTYFVDADTGAILNSLDGYTVWEAGSNTVLPGGDTGDGDGEGDGDTAATPVSANMSPDGGDRGYDRAYPGDKSDLGPTPGRYGSSNLGLGENGIPIPGFPDMFVTEDGTINVLSRTPENNYGYITRGVLTAIATLGATALGGPIVGLITHLAINANNVAALDAARRAKGLEPLSPKQKAKYIATGVPKSEVESTIEGLENDVIPDTTEGTTITDTVTDAVVNSPPSSLGFNSPTSYADPYGLDSKMPIDYYPNQRTIEDISMDKLGVYDKMPEAYQQYADRYTPTARSLAQESFQSNYPGFYDSVESNNTSSTGKYEFSTTRTVEEVAGAIQAANEHYGTGMGRLDIQASIGSFATEGAVSHNGGKFNGAQRAFDENENSWGIGQWNKERLASLKEYAAKEVKDVPNAWQDPVVQAGFFVYELSTTHKHALDAMKAAKTLNAKVEAHTDKFEVAGVRAINDRLGNAHKFENQVKSGIALGDKSFMSREAVPNVDMRTDKNYQTTSVLPETRFEQQSRLSNDLVASFSPFARQAQEITENRPETQKPTTNSLPPTQFELDSARNMAMNYQYNPFNPDVKSFASVTTPVPTDESYEQDKVGLERTNVPTRAPVNGYPKGVTQGYGYNPNSLAAAQAAEANRSARGPNNSQYAPEGFSFGINRNQSLLDNQAQMMNAAYPAEAMYGSASSSFSPPPGFEENLDTTNPGDIAFSKTMSPPSVSYTYTPDKGFVNNYEATQSAISNMQKQFEQNNQTKSLTAAVDAGVITPTQAMTHMMSGFTGTIWDDNQSLGSVLNPPQMSRPFSTESIAKSLQEGDEAAGNFYFNEPNYAELARTLYESSMADKPFTPTMNFGSLSPLSLPTDSSEVGVNKYSTNNPTSTFSPSMNADIAEVAQQIAESENRTEPTMDDFMRAEAIVAGTTTGFDHVSPIAPSGFDTERFASSVGNTNLMDFVRAGTNPYSLLPSSNPNSMVAQYASYGAALAAERAREAAAQQAAAQAAAAQAQAVAAQQAAAYGGTPSYGFAGNYAPAGSYSGYSPGGEAYSGSYAGGYNSGVRGGDSSYGGPSTGTGSGWSGPSSGPSGGNPGGPGPTGNSSSFGFGSSPGVSGGSYGTSGGFSGFGGGFGGGR